MMQIYPAIKRLLTVFVLVWTCQAGIAQPTVTVSSLADGGANSLRAAIALVNGNAAYTTILFDFTSQGSPPYTINLASSLPPIAPASGSLLIDGYSEHLAVAGPIGSRTITVQINGVVSATSGLEINGPNVTVDGLAIFSNTSFGINIDPGISNVTIWGNYIGTDATGLTTGLGNGSAGINVGAISLVPVNSNIIIGTNGDGVNDANEGNLIVGNGAGSGLDAGIIVYNTTGSRFSGNIIGLGKDGVTGGTLANNGAGVIVGDRSSSNIVGTNGDNVSDALEQNIISNNAHNGVWVLSRSNTNTVAGNILGLTATGAAAANIQYGVSIDNSSDNIIGTNADGVDDAQEKNYISRNSTGGVLISSGNLGVGFNFDATGNIVAGNTIGISTDNTTAAGNAGNGITIQALQTGFSTKNNVIGSDGSGANEAVKGNIIANNSTDGVGLTDATSSGLVVGNRISKNSMFSNGGAGIDLVNTLTISGTGITPNQATGFSANDPNALLNFPVITSVTNGTSDVTFAGFARPGALLEFYVSDKGATTPAPHAGLTKNFGQGKRFLFQALQGGTLNGITDAGNAPGSYTTTDEGTSSGPSPITVDPTFSFTINSGSIGLIAGAYTFSAIAIDAGNTSGNVNNTSGFGGNMDATLTVLPITLLNFSGRMNGSVVDLQWTTSEEVNNTGFDIERSSNGSNFQAIGHVQGSLTTNTQHTYNFTDDQPAADVNYYRLKQTDIDGKFSYSKVVVLRNNLANGNVKVFPTSFADNLNISVNTRTADQLEIKIADASGKITNRFSQSTGAGINSFNINSGLGHLAPGIYVLTISGRTISFTQQIVKE